MECDTSDETTPNPMRSGQGLTKKQRKGKGSADRNREFNFDRYAKRFVALEVLYIGWDHHGFAS
eukprot:scaffold680604_cov61-Prasinocladus_malaysianus.AAC.1